MANYNSKIETISGALRRARRIASQCRAAGAAFWAHLRSSTATSPQEATAPQMQTNDYSGPHSESPASGPVDTYDLSVLMPYVPNLAGRYATAQNEPQKPKGDG